MAYYGELWRLNRRLRILEEARDKLLRYKEVEKEIGLYTKRDRKNNKRNKFPERYY
ncbi:MAG: hypothetical protein LBF97_01660 [Elusimicrobiota bacterium]|jgi:hypothetical protein|nr:hypothetical protein [Elusimicrobiota bacterium]